jgi:hypothetical protein
VGHLNSRQVQYLDPGCVLLCYRSKKFEKKSKKEIGKFAQALLAFPVHLRMTDKKCLKKKILVCVHSLGGNSDNAILKLVGEKAGQDLNRFALFKG